MELNFIRNYELTVSLFYALEKQGLSPRIWKLPRINTTETLFVATQDVHIIILQ
jgi:hypothetical protein